MRTQKLAFYATIGLSWFLAGAGCLYLPNTDLQDPNVLRVDSVRFLQPYGNHLKVTDAFGLGSKFVRLETEPDEDGPIVDATLGPDQTLAVITQHGQILLLNADTGERIGDVPTESAALAAAFSPTDERLAVLRDDPQQGSPGSVLLEILDRNFIRIELRPAQLVIPSEYTSFVDWHLSWTPDEAALAVSWEGFGVGGSAICERNGDLVSPVSYTRVFFVSDDVFYANLPEALSVVRVQWSRQERQIVSEDLMADATNVLGASARAGVAALAQDSTSGRDSMTSEAVIRLYDASGRSSSQIGQLEYFRQGASFSAYFPFIVDDLE